MDRFGLFFIRLVMITIGFIAASIAAGVSLAFLTRVITPQEAGELSGAGFDGWMVVATIMFASWTGYVAFFPGMAVIFYGEFTRRRDWLYYAVAGGLIAILAPLFITFVWGDSRPSESEFLVMSLAAGMIGGLAYWLVSGRNAGNWLPSQRQDNPDPS